MSNLRILGLIIILIGFISIFGCGSDKTTPPPAGNNPPAVPFNPSPANEAMGVGTSGVTLRWHCSDPDGDTIKYDFYFDTVSTPTIVYANQLDSTYQPDSLDFARDYYWKVVARDEHGSETASPVWHFSTMPGQERIAFLTERNGRNGIYIMNADGTNAHVVIDTVLGTYYSSLSFSNDGSKIVFGYYYGGNHIYTINYDGTGLFRVTINGWSTNAVWSPDGSQIAYVQDGGNEVFHGGVFVVGANGENPRQITGYHIPNWESENIAWSMQDQIAFPSDSTDGSGYAIYVINSDGTNLRQISRNSYYDSQPAWSHDGTKMAFVRYLTDPERVNIFVMNSDGSDLHNIQNSQSVGYAPCWSPDDSKIAYNAPNADRTNAEIYIMNADGSNPRKVTNSVEDEWNPTWAPWRR